MRSAELLLDQYDSDKIDNKYLNYYDPFFTPLVDKKINLLELGVHKGGSLLLWRDYFPLGTIAGVDISLPKDFKPTERVHLFQGSQTNPAFLSRVANDIAPAGFDVIIDDASHVGSFTKTSFWHLFDNHLKPSGLFVIEDWGTGYWDDWSDGKSFELDSYARPAFGGNRILKAIASRLRLKIPMPNHSYGMVGFIKQLVDEQGAQSVTRKRFRTKPERSSKFESILITPPMVFIRKVG